MQNRKIFSFDIDMTLLEHKTYKITPSALVAIERLKEQGHIIVLATGRNPENSDSKQFVDIVKPNAVIGLNGTLVKVILETCLLTDEEKVKACQLAQKAGADFVKTSTGFSTGGATVEDVALMRKTVGPDMGVKASGGARSYEDALAFIEAGATRIGTSAGVAIMKGEESSGDY